MRVHVFFLVYNEQKIISSLVEDAVSFMEVDFPDYEVTIIDNSSTDNTPQIIKTISGKNPKVTMIRHEKNLGYAASVQDALDHLNGDVAVIVDGDGQHTLEDLPKFMEKICQGYEVVLGWKPIRKDPFYRVIAGWGYNVLFKLAFNFPVWDIDCGYRVLTKKAAEKIHLKNLDMPVGPEFVIQLYTNKLKVAQVSVQHFERQGGESSFRPFAFPILIAKVFLNLISLRIKTLGKI